MQCPVCNRTIPVGFKHGEIICNCGTILKLTYTTITKVDVVKPKYICTNCSKPLKEK